MFACAGLILNITITANETYSKNLQTLQMFSDTSRVMFIKSPAFASDEFELLLYRLRFDTIGMFLSIVRFEEIRFVWFTVRLCPARSNAVMLNRLDHQRDLHRYCYTCVCYMPVMFIAYVEFRSVIFAIERFSSTVIVMFRVLPKVASEVLWLLLYMVRFESSWICVIYCKV